MRLPAVGGSSLSGYVIAAMLVIAVMALVARGPAQLRKLVTG